MQSSPERHRPGFLNKLYEIFVRNWQISVAILIIIPLGVIVYLGYRYDVSWVGVENFFSPEIPVDSAARQEFDRQKTLWDWLNLCIVPIVLALVAYWFSRRTERINREVAEKRIKEDRSIAEERSQQETLDSYFDSITHLITELNLLVPGETGDTARTLARTRTMAVLQMLNQQRKGLLLRFLYEAKLITIPSIVNLSGADLQKADLSLERLDEANLENVDLTRASLSQTSLKGANLAEAQLYFADLSNADLSEANLKDAILSGATLFEATVTASQLSDAKSLEGALMPDGRSFEDWEEDSSLGNS